MKHNRFVFKLPLLIVVFMVLSCKKGEYQLYPIERDNLCGYVDSLGNEIIKPQYLFASQFRNGLAFVVIDTTMKIKKQDLSYDGCKNFNDSSFVTFLLTSKSFKPNIDSLITFRYGYINSSNKIIIDTTLEITLKYGQDYLDILNNHVLTFDDYLFSEGLAVYQDKSTKMYGYIDKKGNLKIKPTYINAFRFSEGLAVVQTKGKKNENKLYGYIDINGKMVIEAKYTQAKKFSEGLGLVFLTSVERKTIEQLRENANIGMSWNWLIINKEGKIIGNPLSGIANTPYSYSDGFSVVEQKFFLTHLGYRFMDKNGNFSTEYNIPDVTMFSNGYAGILLDSGWVFIDKKLNIASKPYENVLPFTNGLAPVKENGKWGYIDTTFTMVITNKFDTCGYFMGELAMFQMKSLSLIIEGYINRKGEVVWQKESYNYGN